MKAYICLAALLTLISSQSFASDTQEASTPASPAISTSAPAVKIRAEVGAVLTRIMSGDGMLSSLWFQRPPLIAAP